MSKETGDKNRWLCVYCRTGIVRSLPSKCPECDKYLNEEVIKRAGKDE
tara:strand:- start:186 stop:329 length:144 start_codon:yes stop_codon:yes gene_type:complete